MFNLVAAFFNLPDPVILLPLQCFQLPLDRLLNHALASALLFGLLFIFLDSLKLILASLMSFLLFAGSVLHGRLRSFHLDSLAFDKVLNDLDSLDDHLFKDALPLIDVTASSVVLVINGTKGVHRVFLGDRF